ncbi:unnamed protein product [Amoebophrya sp. A120]|nr:unnamed protein product [Amoebophrya sp. A120]|eukprot:GSA120T00017968001.1
MEPEEDKNRADVISKGTTEQISSRTAGGTEEEEAEHAPPAHSEQGFDLIFLDARHDYRAVAEDVTAWITKLRPEGPVVLCGHDLQWQYPGLAMAVVAIAKRLRKPVYFASDGMWWLQFGF